MSLQNLFNAKVNILRITSTPGAMGETEVANVLHHNLSCRINWKSGTQRILFNKDTYFRDGKLFCSVVDITTEDRVQYGSVIYEIVGMNNVDEVGKFLVLDIKLVK